MTAFISLIRRLAPLLALCVFMQGCLEKNFAPGTVAVVDGRSISFGELEAARASLFAGQSSLTAPHDDATLHGQYRYTLWRLIEESLVRRFMEKKGLSLEQGLLESEEARIRADYPEGAFEQALTERGILLQDWRQALQRTLMLEQFMHQVLRPQISISTDEAQSYFTAHSKEFLIPEQWHFLRVSGAEQQAVDKAVKRLLSGEDPELVNKDLPVTIHDVHMAVDLLPEKIRKALAPLLPVSASKSAKDDAQFSALVLLEKIPSAMLDPTEISRRVEKVLAEEKMRAIYSDWIGKQLTKAKIRIAPPLAGAYVAPGDAAAPGAASEGAPARQNASISEAAPESVTPHTDQAAAPDRQNASASKAAPDKNKAAAPSKPGQ